MIKLKDNDGTCFALQTIIVIQKSEWTRVFGRSEDRAPALTVLTRNHALQLKYHQIKDRDDDYDEIRGLP